jgi:sodium transport system permease protein
MSPTFQVARKELREMLRDKRLRTSAFFGPIFMMVLMCYIYGLLFSTISKKDHLKIHVVGQSAALTGALTSSNSDIVQLSSVDEGKKLIESGDATVVLDVPTNSVGSGQAELDAYFDPKQQLAQVTLGKIQEFISKTNRDALNGVLSAHSIPTTAAEQTKLVRKEVQVGAKGGVSDILVGMLPYLIVLWAFMAGVSVVSDLVAGEKEKNTLETLLITPVRRTQIVLGKFLCLSAVCLASSLSSLLGLAIASMIHLPGSEILFKNGIGLSPTSVAEVVVLLIPAVAFFASIQLSVSSYAKNPREAQSYLGLLNFAVIMPAIFSSIIGFTGADHSMWVNFVPILNTANNIRMVLVGKASAVPMLITIAISLVLAALAIRLAVALFNREQVLTRV